MCLGIVGHPLLAGTMTSWWWGRGWCLGIVGHPLLACGWRRWLRHGLTAGAVVVVQTLAGVMVLFYPPRYPSTKKKVAMAHGDHGSSHHGLSCWSLCRRLARLGLLGLLARTRGHQTDYILGIMDDRSFAVGCCLGVMRQMAPFVCKNRMDVINSNRFISAD